MAKKISIRRILVATDLTESSVAAIVHGISVAKTHKAKLILLHVVGNIPLLGMRTTDLTAETISKNAIRRAKKELREFVQKHCGKSSAMTLVVQEGDAADTVTEYAKKNAIDLIVLSTHGRRGLSKAIFGSVGEKIVREAEVPVLSVKPYN